jgi:formate dehydrogenase alpha subunit
VTGRATIDGIAVEFQPGETILSAARRHPISIPTLCHVDGCEPEGGCRICLVEIEGDARPRAACHTALEQRMRVHTRSDRLERLRRGILELLASAHPGSLLASRASAFGELLAQYALAPPEHRPEPSPQRAHDHPYLSFDPALCIACRACVHACDEIQGQSVYGILARGSDARLAVGPSDSFLESDCTSCGACVDLCPTGAVTDRDREDPRAAERVTRTTCGYCGVGCRVEVASAGEQILRISGAHDASVNHGHLCAKGRYAHGHVRSPDRLRAPQLRDGKGWKEISWDEALRVAAERLAELHERHGPSALGVLTSSRSTNEAAYLFQKLFRVRFGTNNVDCCARVCHSSTALALQQATGAGAATASYADIERARTIALVGANPTEAHPVLGARIKGAVQGGARLIVIDPRRIELASHADLHLACVPGGNVALLDALAKVVFEEGLADHEYLAERAEGLSELEHRLARLDLCELARSAGVDVELIRAAARALSGPVLFVHGLGLSELVQGTDSVLALCNLAILTGSIGRSGAGMLPLRGQNNVQGNADMGAMPGMITGYQALGAPDARARAEALWGAAPPAHAGLMLPEMLVAARAGELRSLWIQGEDIAQSDPDQTRVIEALEALDFLVVQELFPSETSRYAHLVLPAAGALEQAGTFTNAERRIQLVQSAVSPPGEARPDWLVARDLGRALGLAWDYPGPADVLAEIARISPELFGGVSFERLEPDGLQWPCPHPGHPGTATLHASGFLRGKGKLTFVEPLPNPEHGVAGFPYLLNTGRVLHHYNVGTMTRRTVQRELVGEDVLEIHPRDAERDGIADGAAVAVESRWGRTRVRARHSTRVRPSELFLSFHFPETHANRVVGPHVDLLSRCPQYKATAVRLSAAAPASAGERPPSLLSGRSGSRRSPWPPRSALRIR